MWETICSGEWLASGKCEEGSAPCCLHKCSGGGVVGHSCKGAQWAADPWNTSRLRQTRVTVKGCHSCHIYRDGRECEGLAELGSKVGNGEFAGWQW